MKWLVRLYPRAWRDRYGEEIAALLEEQRLTPGTSLDLIRGALDAWLRPQAHLRTIGGLEMTSADHRAPAFLGLLFVLPALLFLLLVIGLNALGIGYFWDALDRIARDHPDGFRPFNLLSPPLFLGGAALAVVLNMAAAVQLQVHREDGMVAGSFRLRVTLLGLLVTLCGLAVLTFLLTYAFLENFTRR